MKLVDSSVWIEFLRKRGDPALKNIVARLMETDQAAYTCPIGFELLAGVLPVEEENLANALKFSFRVPFETEDWSKAARWERLCREKGLKLPRNDLFVVTVAIRSGLPVVCRDAHFTAARNVLGLSLKVEQV